MTNCYINKGPPLRPYQQEALEKMKQYEGRSALLVLGTGLGKTRIFTEFIRSEVQESDHTCVIVSHREELVKQPLSYMDDLPCGVECGKRCARLGRDKVISASVQSLVNRLHKFNPREVDTIIIDEAHHAAAPTYRKIIEYFVSARVFGFTATAHRGDDIGLGCVFDDLIFEKTILWGIEHEYLTPIEAIQAKLPYDMGAVRIMPETGDFNEQDLAEALSGTAVGVAEAFEQYAAGQTIIFAVSVKEARDIANTINKRAGKRIAECITATTKNRPKILNAYIQNQLRILVNYNVLTEGVDLPMTQTILIARPVAHTNVGVYAQMVGRGLRLHSGKTVCRIIDCVGISDYPICTAATLIGKDIPVSDKTAASPKEKSMPPEQPAVLTGNEIPATWIQYAKDVNVMEKEIGVDAHDVAWTTLNSGGMVLPVPGMVYRVSAPLADGTVYLWKNKKCSKSPMPKQFIFDFVYTDLCKRHAAARHIWDKGKRKFWDREKATKAQLSLISKLAPGYRIDTQYLTRGDASALIQYFIYEKDRKVN